MNPCSKWSRRVSAWFDGEVSEMDAAEVRAHLLDCSGCRNAVSGWGKQRDMLALLQPEEPAPEVISAMAHRFEAGLAAEVHSTSLTLKVWTRVAAALMVASLSFLLLNHAPVSRTAQALAQTELDAEMARISKQISGERYPTSGADSREQ